VDDFVACEEVRYLCDRYEQDLSLYRGHTDSTGRPYGDAPDVLLEQLIEALRVLCPVEIDEDDPPAWARKEKDVQENT